MYDLEFQPLARQDMINIVTYIDKTLNNRATALRFAENMITEIENVGSFPYSGAVMPKTITEKFWNKPSSSAMGCPGPSYATNCRQIRRGRLRSEPR